MGVCFTILFTVRIAGDRSESNIDVGGFFSILLVYFCISRSALFTLAFRGVYSGSCSNGMLHVWCYVYAVC